MAIRTYVVVVISTLMLTVALLWDWWIACLQRSADDDRYPASRMRLIHMLRGSPRAGHFQIRSGERPSVMSTCHRSALWAAVSEGSRVIWLDIEIQRLSLSGDMRVRIWCSAAAVGVTWNASRVIVVSAGRRNTLQRHTASDGQLTKKIVKLN